MARDVTVCRYDKRDGVSAEPLRLKGHNVTEPVGRFGTRMPTEPVGHIGTLLHSQTAETPYTQHYHFGAVIAPSLAGRKGESPTSRPCEASRPTLIAVVISMPALTVHYGRGVTEYRSRGRAVIH
jgi:hypothetical protein